MTDTEKKASQVDAQPPATSRVRRGLAAAGVCVGALLFYVLATIGGAALTFNNVYAGIIGAGFAVFGMILYRFWRYGNIVKVPGAAADVPPRFLAALLVSVTLAWLGGQSLSQWIAGIVPGALDAFAAHQDALNSVPIVVMLLFVLIAAPVGEEALMRGTVYPELRRIMGYVPAALVVASVFAVLHLNLMQLVATFLLGLVLCFAVEFTGRIAVSITLHVVFNLASLLVSAEMIAPLSTPGPAIGLCLLAALSIAWLVREGEAARRINALPPARNA